MLSSQTNGQFSTLHCRRYNFSRIRDSETMPLLDITYNKQYKIEP